MSVTEQEAKGHIAEMRESLQTIRASLRTGTVVRLVGLVVGLLIVGFYVYSFLGMGRELAESGELQAELRRRVEEVPVQRIISTALEQAGPAYMQETQALLKELQIEQAAVEQMQLAMEDLRPVLMEELDRVRPELAAILKSRAEGALSRFESELRTLLEERLENMIRRQQSVIAEGTDLTEEEVQNILINVIEANQEALMAVVNRRWQRDEAVVHDIGQMMLEFPELPRMTEEELLEETRDVLLALLKRRLPDYQFDELPITPPQEQVEMPTLEELRAMPEDAREVFLNQLPSEAAEGLRRALEQEE
ncbi:MAG: hypothetical protein R6X33_19625 [Candidatus Brocadiia bacterium]